MSNRVIKKVPIKQGLYEESVTQQGDIGGVLEFEDGRKFVYSKAGEGLTLGVFCQGPIENSNGYDEELVLPTSIAVGDKTVTVTTQRAWTANELKDGYLMIEDETANVQGTIRKIKSHPAAGSAESCVITVYDAFVVAATVGIDTVTVIKNPYSGVMMNNTTTDGPLLGLPMLQITNAYYFWLQVAGIACGTSGENSLVVGDMVCVDAVAGTLMLMNTAGDAQLVGQVMNTSDTSGNMTLIMLKLGR